MNYQHAAELRDADGNPSGLWHYVESNRREGTHPIGYCSPWEPCPDCDCRSVLLPNVVCERCDSKGLLRVADPCLGHPTPEEAAEHYRQWLLDHRLRLDGARDPETQRRCEADGCDEWTQTVATLNGARHIWALCDEHRTRETVETLFGAVGESWGS